MDAGKLPAQVQLALPLLAKFAARGRLSVSTPEGYAYYALHPLDYADVLSGNRIDASRAFVIGIRSIGTSLSAVVAAKLRQTGIPADRLTVRPTGHPYDRRCDFDHEQRRLIGDASTSGVTFVVCDEGPGRSGSSFLSVAEALEREGVPRHCIVLLCSHEPDVRALCAPDAATRWSRYRSLASGMTPRLPTDAGECLGGGDWRRLYFNDAEQWPALWPQMERLRYLSRDGSSLFTFEGHGPMAQALEIAIGLSPMTRGVFSIRDNRRDLAVMRLHRSRSLQRRRLHRRS